MEPKSLGFLSARVENRQVVLSAYKTYRYFEDAAPAGEFERVRIQRIATDFVFGTDYEECFQGCKPGEQDVIFEGALAAGNHRKYTFVDNHVEAGRTYTYFMGSRSAAVPPVGPVAIKVRDWELWWPYQEVMRRMSALAARHPALAQFLEIGKTARGKALHALKLGSGPRVMGLVGIIHAGESGPELILPALEKLLEESPTLFQRVTVLAIPSVNWEEREREVRGLPWYLRCNSNAVDLNRNFPADWETIEYGYGLDSSDPDSMTYRGPSPASEPETQALMRLFTAHPPTVVYSYHAMASITGSFSLAAKCGESDSAYCKLAERWSSLYGAAFAGPDQNTSGLRFACTSGSLPAWIYRQFGAPCFDLENCKSIPKTAARDVVDRETLRKFQLKHEQGIRAAVGALA